MKQKISQIETLKLCRELFPQLEWECLREPEKVEEDERFCLRTIKTKAILAPQIVLWSCQNRINEDWVHISKLRMSDKTILEVRSSDITNCLTEIQRATDELTQYFYSSSLAPHLKHLGRTPEEQLKLNQPAMEWAMQRLKELDDKRKNVETNKP